MKKISFVITLIILGFVFFPLNKTSSVNAATYQEHYPTYSIYTRDNIITKETINYDIATVEDLEIVAEMRYNISAEQGSAHDLYIPFGANLYDMPYIEIRVNDMIITPELLYGDKYMLYNADKSIENAISRAYNSSLNDSVTGTLYKVTASSNEMTISYKKSGEQSLVYECGNSYKASISDDIITYTTNVTQGQVYNIFVTEGDFEFFGTQDSYTKKETTCKEFVDSYYALGKEFYEECNINIDYLYAEMNRFLASKNTIRLEDLFYQFSNYRMNFLKFTVEMFQSVAVVTCTQKAKIQQNTIFEPTIFLFEHYKTVNYTTEYNIKMTEEYPYIIESNLELKKNENSYKIESNSDSFYCVYCSESFSKNKFNNEETYDKNVGWLIVIIACSVIGFGGITYLIVSSIRKK